MTGRVCSGARKGRRVGASTISGPFLKIGLSLWAEDRDYLLEPGTLVGFTT